jgi:hypothetical protein
MGNAIMNQHIATADYPRFHLAFAEPDRLFAK